MIDVKELTHEAYANLNAADRMEVGNLNLPKMDFNHGSKISTRVMDPWFHYELSLSYYYHALKLYNLGKGFHRAYHALWDKSREHLQQMTLFKYTPEELELIDQHPLIHTIVTNENRIPGTFNRYDKDIAICKQLLEVK